MWARRGESPGSLRGRDWSWFKTLGSQPSLTGVGGLGHPDTFKERRVWKLLCSGVSHRIGCHVLRSISAGGLWNLGLTSTHVTVERCRFSSWDRTWSISVPGSLASAPAASLKLHLPRDTIHRTWLSCSSLRNVPSLGSLTPSWHPPSQLRLSAP